MITAERLEELRNQCATVYIVFAGEKEATALNIVDVDEWLLASRFLETVFETKEQAEWAEKMYTERTERFEPPMWEDIEKDGYLFTFIKPKDIHTIAFAVNWGVLWENEIVILYDDDYCVDECRTIFNEPATKENYIKACEIVRDLFNRGNK